MDLGKNDCALIIREDLSTELVIPDMPDDSTEAAPNNVVLITAVVMALNDDNIMKIIFDQMDEKLEEHDDKVSGD